jgi:hypothetical protein
VSPAGSPDLHSGSSTDRSSTDFAADAALPLPTPPPVQGSHTRLQQGIHNPKIYTDGTIRYGMFTSTGQPSKLSEALEDACWCEAM